MIDEQDPETNIAVAMAVGVAIFISMFTIAVALSVTGHLTGASASISTTASPRSAPVVGSVLAPTALLPSDASLVVLLFESAKTEIPDDAARCLQTLVERARSGERLVVSGFHDATGDTDKNAELAKLRAIAVRDALVAMGVGGDRIDLAKPQQTLGGTDQNFARRVEVSVRP